MRVLLAAAMAAGLLVAPAHAQPGAAESDVITVWGARQRQVGVAFSASDGVVDFGRFVDRPLLRVGELAEVVPGLAATQHSGTGKANQYFLRGFNLDHGTDFSISLDGMPVNQRTHAHGQGYLDINFFIPEIVERIGYRKGVADVRAGDFSAAGSAAFSTFDVLPESFAQVEAGENNWRRLVGAAAIGEAGYVALDVTADDGPWRRPEDLLKVNGFARFTLGAFSVSGGAYRAEWDAADQIPLRAVQGGLIDRLDVIDRAPGGKTERLWLNGAYAKDGLAANLYAQRYSLNLYSNFTYFLDDPANGDGFEQAERRNVYGGAVSKTFAAWGNWTPSAGLEARLDRIEPVGLYRSASRQRLATVRQDRVEQDSVGAFVAAAGDYGRARINLGVRADAMRVDVASDDPRNSGEADDTIVSPKAALAWRFTDALEGYASYGRGFHSNDARGATIAFDPASGDPASPVPLLVQAEGAELGLRYERDGIALAASVFGLDLESELVYVGDAGATEASDASRRTGVEVSASWIARPWLTLDASAAATRARFRDVPGGADRIPLANEYVVTGGATVSLADAWTGSLTVRHLGPSPLIEDDSARSGASTVVNGRLAWRAGRFTVAVEGLNLADSDDADITYFYASRLAGETPDGVEDVHFHPVPPRSLRLQVRAKL